MDYNISVFIIFGDVKMVTLLTKSILVSILLFQLLCQPVSYHNAYKPKINEHQTLALSSIFTDNADVTELMMSESIQILVDLYRKKEIDGKTIDDILLYFENTAKLQSHHKALTRSGRKETDEPIRASRIRRREGDSEIERMRAGAPPRQRARHEGEEGREEDTRKEDETMIEAGERDAAMESGEGGRCSKNPVAINLKLVTAGEQFVERVVKELKSNHEAQNIRSNLGKAPEGTQDCIRLSRQLLERETPNSIFPSPLTVTVNVPWVTDMSDAPLFIQPACALCGKSEYRILLEVVINENKVHIVQCNHDGLMWITPQPSKNFYEQLYGEWYYKVADHPSLTPEKRATLSVQVGIRDSTLADKARKKEIATKQINEIITRYVNLHVPFWRTRPGSISFVEIGGGSGYVCQAAQEKEFRVINIELSKRSCDESRRNNVPAYNGTLESAMRDGTVHPHSADIIVAYDLIEHITFPNEFLPNIKELLKDGGIFVFRSPCTPNVGPTLHLIDHVYHYSFETIEKMLEKHGLEIYDAYYSGTFTDGNGTRIENMTIFAKKKGDRSFNNPWKQKEIMYKTVFTYMIPNIFHLTAQHMRTLFHLMPDIILFPDITRLDMPSNPLIWYLQRVCGEIPEDIYIRQIGAINKAA